LPAVGATVPYAFVVTNTGNVTMGGITLADPNAEGVSCPATTLAPGASTTCTAVHVVQQADIDAGKVVNTATVTGTPPDGTPIPPLPSNEVTVTGVQIPGLSIVKASTTASVSSAGQLVPYTFTVTNTGNVTITDIAVTDPNTDEVICPQTTLEPDDATTCTATYTVTAADLDRGQVANTATVTGTPPGDTPLPPVTSNTVNVPAAQSPSLALTKAAAIGATAVGHVIVFTMTVTNTGNVTITDITVNDPKVAIVDCPHTALPAGATMSCTAGYTITADDAAARNVTNTATVVGTPPDGAALAPIASNQVIVPLPRPADPPTTTTDSAPTTITTTTPSTPTTTTTTTTASRGQLPATGTEVAQTLRTVLALTLIGAALTTISRRRRRSTR
jgi:uncharacterized repeat protein (TIGR01451 family)